MSIFAYTFLSSTQHPPIFRQATKTSTMATDNLFPDSVKDFVFDLHDASRRSFVPSELHALYTTSFREVTAKYFSNTAWPAPDLIASECSNDSLFLALYNELTLRHLQSVKRPNVRDRIEGWHAYRTLFDLILDEAPVEGGETKGRDSLFLIPEWCFDILHEFLYQFQGFCQFRVSAFRGVHIDSMCHLPTHLFATIPDHNLLRSSQDGRRSRKISRFPRP